MGTYLSRENNRIEELDSTASNAYRYPPKEGHYFCSHYIMGGERFETTFPEAYLFGENMDLNFLGNKPTPFPYPAPQPNEPTKTLRSLVHIRKETLRFIRVVDQAGDKSASDPPSSNTRYNISFVFDSDVTCSITIYYFCTEEVTPNAVIYTPKDASITSDPFRYKKGVNQQFSQSSHIFDPSKFSEDMLGYKFDDEIIPVLIQCVAEEGEEPRQSQMIYAIIEKNPDDTYTLKALQQKLFVDGLCYLLKEMYGIENKNQTKDISEEDGDDTGSECVICMSEARDTLILPCRHLCLCNNCADSLRYQANNCPICRAPFRALLQIRAVRKSTGPQIAHNADTQSSEDIPLGYESVCLIEALNGPCQPCAPLVPFVPGSVPLFGNSPDLRPKHRHLDRHHASATSLRLTTDPPIPETIPADPLKPPSDKSVPEVAILNPDKGTSVHQRVAESLSLNRGEGRRHRKGFRTSSAPEKMRLLATNSLQIVERNGRKLDKDAELAETRSLLESHSPAEDTTTSSPKPSRPTSRSSPISLSTPHSLHLCERSSKDTSPCGDDSDYFTPEDPSTTILVDQGTDTSLDQPASHHTTTTKHHPSSSTVAVGIESSKCQ